MITESYSLVCSSTERTPVLVQVVQHDGSGTSWLTNLARRVDSRSALRCVASFPLTFTPFLAFRLSCARMYRYACRYQRSPRSLQQTV